MEFANERIAIWITKICPPCKLHRRSTVGSLLVATHALRIMFFISLSFPLSSQLETEICSFYFTPVNSCVSGGISQVEEEIKMLRSSIARFILPLLKLRWYPWVKKFYQLTRVIEVVCSVDYNDQWWIVRRVARNLLRRGGGEPAGKLFKRSATIGCREAYKKILGGKASQIARLGMALPRPCTWHLNIGLFWVINNIINKIIKNTKNAQWSPCCHVRLPYMKLFEQWNKIIKKGPKSALDSWLNENLIQMIRYESRTFTTIQCCYKSLDLESRVTSNHGVARPGLT